MKVIQLSLISIITVMSLLWAVVNVSALTTTHELFAWRILLLQYSGILAMSVMGLGMLLAMRCSWIEN